MSYQFLCPKCGRGFLEGTSLENCPDCAVPLEHTTPAGTADSAADTIVPVAAQAATLLGLVSASRADLTDSTPLAPSLAEALQSGKLPEHLDIDQLLRKVLAEQAPEETIDAALNRVLSRDFPTAADPLNKLLCLQLDLYEQAGKTRQQAAEELARSQSELTATPGGHQIRSTHVTSVQGLEKLPPAMRKLVEKQLTQAFNSGKPISAFKMQLGGARIIATDSKSAPGGATGETADGWSFASGPLLGMQAPPEFCSIALAELEAAGVARATERAARVDKLWESPRLQRTFNRLTSRPLQFAVPATIAAIILTAAAGLQPGFMLAATIATAFAIGGLARTIYKSRLKSALREEIEFPSASQ